MDSDILSTNNIPNVFMDVGNNVRPKSNIRFQSSVNRGRTQNLIIISWDYTVSSVHI